MGKWENTVFILYSNSSLTPLIILLICATKVPIKAFSFLFGLLHFTSIMLPLIFKFIFVWEKTLERDPFSPFTVRLLFSRVISTLSGIVISSFISAILAMIHHTLILVNISQYFSTDSAFLCFIVRYYSLCCCKYQQTKISSWEVP